MLSDKPVPDGLFRLPNPNELLVSLGLIAVLLLGGLDSCSRLLPPLINSVGKTVGIRSLSN